MSHVSPPPASHPRADHSPLGASWLLARARIIGAALIIAGAAPSPVLAAIDARFSNAPAFAGEPANFNAQVVENALSLSHVTVAATNSIAVTEDVDVSQSVFGGFTIGNLRFDTSTFGLNGDLRMGNGAVNVNAANILLDGRLSGPAGYTAPVQHGEHQAGG